MEEKNNQPNNIDKKAEEKRQKLLQEKLDNEYTIKFKKREWIVIYNLLISEGKNPRFFTLGDARLILPIVDKIQAIAALDDNAEEGVVVN